jgi:lipoate-protein ligase A
VDFLDLTLPTPEENLALDEALLMSAEADGHAEYLRVWESPTYFVVLGKNCRIEEDVLVDHCRADGIAILRRISGGGTVLVGPGCLNYALVLRFDRDRRLLGVTESFDYILDRVLAAIRLIAPAAGRAGASDLIIGDQKFSGNSQRRQRTHLLHHGTVLHKFDLARVTRCLREPPRQPAHRRQRDHVHFLTNIGTAQGSLTDAIRYSFEAAATCDDWPQERVSEIVRTRFADRNWLLRLN